MMMGSVAFSRHKRRNRVLTAVAAIVSCQRWIGTGAHAFVRPYQASISGLLHAKEMPRRLPTSIRSYDNDSEDFDLNLFVRGAERANRLVAQRFNRANKIEIRNDAILAASFVLGRFLTYDIPLSVNRITPGWELQDVVWLTGTLSSATVLVLCYAVAGLLTRTYDVDVPSLPPPAVRALVNVALSCPAWLLAEHLMGYGPADIAGNTFGCALETGLVGLGLFMAVGKTISTDMR